MLAIAVFYAFACQGACSSSTSPPSSEPSADQACSDSSHARCTRFMTCSSTWLSEVYSDEATCESRVKTACMNAAAAPQNANSPSKVEACATAIPGWSCDDIVAGANPPAACEQVTGPVAMGSPCSANGQCQTGFCGLSNSACGTCTVAPTAGQPCTGAHQCAPGLACAGDGNCAAFAKQGAACGASQPCAPGNQCVGGACKQTDSAVAAGQPCGNVNGMSVGCVGGTCENQGGTVMCAARAADGAVCNPPGGPFCEPPALCVGGTCQIAACK